MLIQGTCLRDRGDGRRHHGVLIEWAVGREPLVSVGVGTRLRGCGRC